MINYEEIRKNEDIRTYIAEADASLAALGFTEHSFAHVTHVAETAGYILETLGYPEQEIELAKIAGYLHDIGNLVNRIDHSQSGAVMAFRLLDKLHFTPREIAVITTAIGRNGCACECCSSSAHFSGQIRCAPFTCAKSGCPQF